MDISLIKDSIYFSLIAIKYNYNGSIVPITIPYYIYETINNKSDDKFSKLHHILGIIVLGHLYKNDICMDIVNKIIVDYNLTTLSLLILKECARLLSDNIGDQMVLLSLLIITIYLWIKIRIVWSLDMYRTHYPYSLLLLPFIFLNIYWLYMIGKKSLDKFFLF
jgi:hypothetical protein